MSDRQTEYRRNSVKKVVREVTSVLDQIQADEPTSHEIVAMFAPKEKTEEPETSGLPDYVQHNNETPEIARLANEVLIRSWELAAQDIEQMGNQLQHQVDHVLATVKESAASIRRRGVECFSAIELAAQMADVVSRQCSEIRCRLSLRDIAGAAAITGPIKQTEKESSAQHI